MHHANGVVWEAVSPNRTPRRFKPERRKRSDLEVRQVEREVYPARRARLVHARGGAESQVPRVPELHDLVDAVVVAAAKTDGLLRVDDPREATSRRRGGVQGRVRSGVVRRRGGCVGIESSEG